MIGKISTFIIFMYLVLILGSNLRADDGDKLTARARSLVTTASQFEINNYWVYLNADRRIPEVTNLSEKSLKRRAKVDPAGFLFDDRDRPVDESVIDSIRQTGAHVRRVSRWFNAVAVEADAEQLNRLEALPSVRKIDLLNTLVTHIPDDVLKIRPVVIEPQADDLDYGSSLFQNRYINAVRLHQAGLTGRGVMIAMFDSGFRPDHPAFDSTSIVATWDFINNDEAVDEVECLTSPSRDHQTYHGTATLGVIGANVPGELIGVAPHADFILAKTEITCNNTEIKLEEDNWIAAAEWADSAGADIINSSLGYFQFTDSGSYVFEDLDGNTALISIAADIAASKNILVVNSAGNERNNSWGHIVAPSDGDSVLAVGATNPDSSLAGFSSPGPSADGQIKPDISTLGVNVFTASHLGGYASINGTSLSAPLTSGGAALAFEHDSTLTAMELLDLIRSTGSSADMPDNNFGYGLYDAAAAADIIRLILPEQITLTKDGLTSLEVETRGRSDSIGVLGAFDLPDWAQFSDHGDGTGTLDLMPASASEPVKIVGLTADVGYYADTSFLTLRILGVSENTVYVGPNPMSDSLRIFVEPIVGRLISTSIFNTFGEIVWEKVNNSAPSADLLTEAWNGRNQQGEVVAAGVYLLVVKTERQTFRIKLLKTD